MQSLALGDHKKLQSFLNSCSVATLALPVDMQGDIHVAALLYWHTESPLSFYFVTDKSSEKCKLLVEEGRIRAACVVGTEEGTEFTLQMRGDATVSNDSSIIESYYLKRGNRNDDISDGKNIMIQFMPDWARFTDYSNDRHRYMLDIAT